MSPAPSAPFTLYRPLRSLLIAASTLVAWSCRDVNGPEPARAPRTALAAKTGIPKDVPLRIDGSIRAAPGAAPFACSSELSVPAQLIIQGVMSPHMGRSTGVLVVSSCQVTDGVPQLGAQDTTIGAPGDSLFGSWVITISKIQNGKATLGLEIIYLRGSGWFGNAIGTAAGSGVLDLATNTGSYAAAGTIGPRPEPGPVGGPQLVAETISTGMDFSCGLTISGVAYCWGVNRYGQLGDGTTTNRAIPTPVASAATFTQISAGEAHACALTSFGDAYCWGWNDDGQLGVGDRAIRSTPTPAAGGHVFKQISAGEYHTCGVISSGQAYCWGYNAWGQVGDGTLIARSTPTAVRDGLAFEVLSAGGLHTCALTATGAAYCWGGNAAGNLGDGTTTERRTPTAVTGGFTFAQITTGHDHTCALLGTTLEAYCWGHNFDSQLGDGTHTDRQAPVPVSGSPRFSHISAGFQHTCAATFLGSAFCWGFNGHGELGDGTLAQRTTPTAVVGAIAVRRISAGGYHTCAATTTRVGYCWGDNLAGELGYATSSGRSEVPGQISSSIVGGLRFTLLTSGYAHTCGMTSAGVAYCWGNNLFGQVGDGGTAHRYVPAPVVGALHFKDLSAGGVHTCAVRDDGQAVCWGSNTYGQLGDGTSTDRTEPTAIASAASFNYIRSGTYHTCAIASGGAVYCWGDNSSGQLGDGTTTTHHEPTLITGAYAFGVIATGKAHTCALTRDGAAYCWGNYGGISNSSAPVPVPAAEPFVDIAAGDRTTCGVTRTNNVYCWGVNANGQLGDGTTNTIYTPTRLIVTSGQAAGIPLVQVGLGESHACVAAYGNGAAFCAGGNSYGQLGDNTTTERHLFTAVDGTLPFERLTGGGEHTCGLSAGAAYCSGRNNFGQLGNDDTNDRHVPTAVTRFLFKF